MTRPTPSLLNNVITIDDKRIKNHRQTALRSYSANQGSDEAGNLVHARLTIKIAGPLVNRGPVKQMRASSW